MAHERRAFPYLGVYLAWLGIMLGVIAFAPEITFGWLDPETWTVANNILVAAGSLSALLGVTLMASRYRKKRSDPTLKPASVAFSETPRDVRSFREPTPQVANRAAVAALPPELVALENDLKELNVRINRATVMLGTGKLSREGYAAYVDEIKSQRAELESRKVRLLHAAYMVEGAGEGVASNSRQSA